jgi:hypothetical protein
MQVNVTWLHTWPDCAQFAHERPPKPHVWLKPFDGARTHVVPLQQPSVQFPELHEATPPAEPPPNPPPEPPPTPLKPPPVVLMVPPLHMPKEQLCPSPHALQLSPRWPHWAELVNVTHWPEVVSQQPVQDVGVHIGRTGPQLLATTPKDNPKQSAKSGSEAFMKHRHPTWGPSARAG